jgi:hypothetical protein
MALIYSSSIVTDGLVFYYDAGNTKKSYTGRPATNLITNGDFSGGLNAGTGGTGGDNPLNEVVQFANPGDSPYCLRSTAVGGNVFTEYQMDQSGLAAGTTYVMSCWYYFSPDWNGTTAIFHSRAYSASGANTATGSDAGISIETRVVNGVTWTRAYRTITTPADATGVFNWYLGYPSSNTAGFRYFTNVQFEVGSYPSPFVKGSRTSTSSILNLVGNNTITINSLTYANDAITNFSFNGSSNSITTTSPSMPTDSFTIEIILYPTSFSNSPIVICPQNAGIDQFIQFNTTGTFIFKMAAGGDVGERSYTSADACPLNNFSHITCVKSGTSVALYRNGVLTASTSADTTATAGWGSTTWVIGQRGNSTFFFAGSIPVVRAYGRGLTAAEVQQNFNALRGRYGL